MAQSPYNTRILPGRYAEPGRNGAVMPNSGMSVSDLVAAAMGQQNYLGEQRQQSADAMQASTGQLMGLLRGGVSPMQAQGAAGMQMQGIRGPSSQESDPFLDSLAAGQFQRETDFRVQEEIMRYLQENEPDFWDKFGSTLMSLGGMAAGGALSNPIASGGMGGAAGAGLGGSVAATLATLINQRYPTN